ncbi:MAG TPA: hypothetical protein VGZ32_13370 [Actinocrinis sp.]|uniref:hypothetical protein n=1 Tax=Actinocrinis sp. TaxID=1920516 RepID=UPI002DDD0771|nr:hypothetical protein [Actinocrinis sp.]HEV3171334.1 hypothetical protein [Actinocrinis sp.]
MNIIRGRQAHAQAERADDVGGGTLGRRGVLGGLAALPVLYSIGSATPAQAATAAQPGSVPQATDDLVRGMERRYNAPLLTPGTCLVLPAGIKAVAVQDYYHQPHTASAQTAWPNVTAADGTTVDASVVPDRGAPSRIALLSGFAEGWYELRHASGRTDRVTWDARKLPILWLYGEYGATDEAPFHNRFYTLALQALSRNPYSHKTLAK